MTNKICYFEIGCRDRAKTADFYSKLFEWKMQPEASMTRIRTGDDVNGHINSLGHEPHHYAIFYVMVDDVATALTKAVSLGGKKLVGPVPLPGGQLLRMVFRSRGQHDRSLRRQEVAQILSAFIDAHL